MGLFGKKSKMVDVDQIEEGDEIEVTLTNGRVSRGQVVEMMYRRQSGQYFFRVDPERILAVVTTAMRKYAGGHNGLR